MKTSLSDLCLRQNRDDLLEEWHPKNAPLTPADVAPASHKKVWWRCRRGHEWQAEVCSRTAGKGCPVCAGRRLAPGENDLASTRPDLAAQWDAEKNGALTPRQLAEGSHRKVWWRCKRGHSWRAGVNSRAAGGAGCPVCGGKTALAGDNDLATLFPGLCAQFDPDANPGLTPQELTPWSNRRVGWRCDKGHTWTATVASRTANLTGCPYCAGRKVLPGFNDLATKAPLIAAQWHPSLNGALTAEMVTVGSHKKVWWQCPEGHVWKAVIYSRAGAERCGCPVCAGKRKEDRRRATEARLA